MISVATRHSKEIMMKNLIAQETVLDDPPIARRLFGDTRLAWLWLPLRVYLGYAWLTSGWGKLQNPKWVETGEALSDFWTNGVRIDPRPVIAVDWYRELIQWMLDT